MDWQFKVGVGLSILFGLLPYAIKDMPQSITWAGVVAGLLLIVWGFVPSHDKMAVGPTLLLIASLSGLVGSIVWYRSSAETEKQSATSSALHSGALVEQGSPIDNTIMFQCSSSGPPTTYRADRTLYIVQFQGIPVHGPDYQGQIAGSVSFPRSSDPFRANPASDWVRCDVTNYGSKPLRNIRARFPVQFLEVVKTEDGYRSGAVHAAGQALAPGLDLGTGANNSDYFYFSNNAPAFVVVSYPPTAQAQTLDEDQAHEIKLVPPTRDSWGVVMEPEIKGSQAAFRRSTMSLPPQRSHGRDHRP